MSTTYVITSFNDSIALSRVTLSGLSSVVCFLISTIKKQNEITNHTHYKHLKRNTKNSSLNCKSDD